MNKLIPILSLSALILSGCTATAQTPEEKAFKDFEDFKDRLALQIYHSPPYPPKTVLSNQEQAFFLCKRLAHNLNQPSTLDFEYANQFLSSYVPSMTDERDNTVYRGIHGEHLLQEQFPKGFGNAIQSEFLSTHEQDNHKIHRFWLARTEWNFIFDCTVYPLEDGTWTTGFLNVFKESSVMVDSPITTPKEQ